MVHSIPSQTTIAQFIKSGQLAFGSVDAQSLASYNDKPGQVQKWMLDEIRGKLAAASHLYQDDILILRPLLKLKYPAVDATTIYATGYDCLLPEILRLLKSNLTYAVTFTNYVLAGSDTEVPRAFKEDLLHAVAQILGEVSMDTRERETIESQTVAHEKTKHEDVPQPQLLTKLSPDALGAFVKHFYGLGLYKPIETMLTNLQSATSQAHSIDIHLIYLPFLQKLISLMLIYGVPYTNAKYSSFFANILQQYFVRFVGQEPAQHNSTEHEAWKGRALAACSTLDSFDHSYFQEILGDQYERIVLSAMMKLPR